MIISQSDSIFTTTAWLCLLICGHVMLQLYGPSLTTDGVRGPVRAIISTQRRAQGQGLCLVVHVHWKGPFIPIRLHIRRYTAVGKLLTRNSVPLRRHEERLPGLWTCIRVKHAFIRCVAGLPRPKQACAGLRSRLPRGANLQCE